MTCKAIADNARFGWRRGRFVRTHRMRLYAGTTLLRRRLQRRAVPLFDEAQPAVAPRQQGGRRRPRDYLLSREPRGPPPMIYYRVQRIRVARATGPRGFKVGLGSKPVDGRGRVGATWLELVPERGRVAAQLRWCSTHTVSLQPCGAVSGTFSGWGDTATR